MISKTQEKNITQGLNINKQQNIDESVPEEIKPEDVFSKLELDLIEIRKTHPDAVILNDKIISKSLNKYLDVCIPEIHTVKRNFHDFKHTLEVFSYINIKGIPVYASKSFVVGYYNGVNRNLYLGWQRMLQDNNIDIAFINILREDVQKGWYHQLKNINMPPLSFPYIKHHV